MSIVVPAYNEELRLGDMLTSTLQYMNKHHKNKFEVIVVDDGSKDQTVAVAKDFNVKVLKLSPNRGKGRAVRLGCLAASGKWVLFADADGATRFEDFGLFWQQREKFDVICGSRAHMVTEEAVVKRSFIRNLLMRCFHLILAILSSSQVRAIKDTQCGFKMFSRKAVDKIFPSLHLEGWLFDVEILHLCGVHNLKVIEQPVQWHEVDGSKMSLIRDSVKMLWDLLVMRMSYILGVWK